MVENRSGEGGAANTPPFPRLPFDGADSPTHSVPRPPPTPHGEPAIEDPTIWAAAPTANEPESDDESPLPPPRSASRRPPAFAAADIRHYAERTLARSCVRIADRLEGAADRIAFIAQNRPGGAADATDPTRSAVGWMQGTAEYLRESDLPTMQSDLEQRVREKPLQTLLLALTTGWLLGRILR